MPRPAKGRPASRWVLLKFLERDGLFNPSLVCRLFPRAGRDLQSRSFRFEATDTLKLEANLWTGQNARPAKRSDAERFFQPVPMVRRFFLVPVLEFLGSTPAPNKPAGGQ